MVLGSCQVSDGLKSWPEDVTFHSRWTGSSADLMFPAQVIFSPGYFKNAWKSGTPGRAGGLKGREPLKAVYSLFMSRLKAA